MIDMIMLSSIFLAYVAGGVQSYRWPLFDKSWLIWCLIPWAVLF